MRIVRPDLLKSYHGRGQCEGCGGFVETGPHHCFVKRGLSGGTRLDVSMQLIRVGWWCCHSKAETNIAFNEELKAKIAKREGSTVQCITDALRFLRMVPKKASAEWLEVAMQGLQPEPRRLARSALIEAGLLTGIG